LPAALERSIATTAEATAAAIGHLHNDKKANAACRAAGLGYIEEVFSEVPLDALMRQALGPAIRALAKNETAVAK
jgi:hypothetical protein